jgi:hypothetical protein
MFEHFLQSLRRAITALCPVSQPDRIEGEQAGFDPGEEERN